MTKENAHLYLPLVQALAEGKTIQYNSTGEWCDFLSDSVAFGNEPEHYRIKPEPQEIEVWVTQYDSGKICSITTSDMSNHGWIKTTATVQVP